MFRKNHIPKGTIHKCSLRDKYFFKSKTHSDNLFEFYMYAYEEDLAKENNIKRINFLWSKATYYDTVEELMSDLYESAYERHLDEIHCKITYDKGIKI